MSLLTILVTLIVVGILLYLVNTYIPMDDKIKKIINIVAIVGVSIWILKVSGILSYLSSITL